MIGIKQIGFYKQGSGIHIKKKNRGKFTDYCNGKVTSECIARGKKSKNPLTRKRATFAANSRRWKHEEGSKIHKPNNHRSVLDNGWISTKQLKKKHRSGDGISLHEKGGIIKGLEGIPGIEETPPSSLPYTETLRFIRDLENPKGKGLKNGKATLYDKRTAGYGTDIVSGHPELANKIKSGKWTEKEARDQAVTDMRRHDATLMKQLSEYTNRPDTVSVGPRLLMAQARYHYGNLKSSFPEWAKAVAQGNANKQKELALKLAKGYPDRYQKIQSFNIYK